MIGCHMYSASCILCFIVGGGELDEHKGDRMCSFLGVFPFHMFLITALLLAKHFLELEVYLFLEEGVRMWCTLTSHTAYVSPVLFPDLFPIWASLSPELLWCPGDV